MQTNLDKTEALHAFRTIVTMLSLIHSKGEGNDSSLFWMCNDLKDELRLVDALAAICARKNEVVAIVAKHDGFGNIDAIGSVNLLHTKRPQSAGVISDPFVAPSQNPISALPSPPVVPVADKSVLVDPEISVPQQLKDCASSGGTLLQAFLTHEW